MTTKKFKKGHQYTRVVAIHSIYRVKLRLAVSMASLSQICEGEDICGEGFFDTYPLQLPANHVFHDLSFNLNLYIFIQIRHRGTLIMKSFSDESQ